MTTVAMSILGAEGPLARARRQAHEATGVAGSLALHAAAALAVVLLAAREPRPPPEPLTVELVIEQPAALAPEGPTLEGAVLEPPPRQPAPAVPAVPMPVPTVIELPPPDEAPPVSFETPPAAPLRKPAMAVAEPAPAPRPVAPVIAADPAPPTVAAPSTTATAPVTAPPAAPQARSRYGAILLAWLERYRDYPRAARLRRQEGEVLLRLTVDRAGRLLAAEIAQPSGIDVLDQAALDTARRAAPMPPVPVDEPGDRLILLVPVLFALAKG